MAERRRQASRSTLAMVELLRLAIVGLTTAGGFALGPGISDLFDSSADVEQVRFLASLLGALTGYVLGGGIGRAIIRGVHRAEERLQRVEATVLIAAVLGGVLAASLVFAFTWPVIFLPFQRVTVPVTMTVAIVVVYAGVRFGAGRAGDLARFVGVRGRIKVATPARGGGVKVADTSALIDGRLLDVARAGFLEGTLVIPTFVLLELQGLADAEDRRRRERGRRGLDVLKTLQDDGAVPVEIADDDVPLVAEVDAKLVELCRQRGAALVTVDANLSRVAEVSGVRTLSLHRLAEALRPPVLPGDRIELGIVKVGREPEQGVGYLEDGTMVVVERAADCVGRTATVDITSVTSTRNGRMLFATAVED